LFLQFFRGSFFFLRLQFSFLSRPFLRSFTLIIFQSFETLCFLSTRSLFLQLFRRTFLFLRLSFRFLSRTLLFRFTLVIFQSLKTFRFLSTRTLFFQLLRRQFFLLRFRFRFLSRAFHFRLRLIIFQSFIFILAHIARSQFIDIRRLTFAFQNQPLAFRATLCCFRFIIFQSFEILRSFDIPRIILRFHRLLPFQLLLLLLFLLLSPTNRYLFQSRVIKLQAFVAVHGTNIARSQLNQRRFILLGNLFAAFAGPIRQELAAILLVVRVALPTVDRTNLAGTHLMRHACIMPSHNINPLRP